MKISLIGGRVVDPVTAFDGLIDVHLEMGKIIALGDAPTDFKADKCLNVTGQVISQGLVDLSAKLWETSTQRTANIATESQAALLNGITTLCCPPDMQPIIDNSASLELLQQRNNNRLLNLLPLAALTKNLAGEQLTEMQTLHKMGCVGVSNAQFPVGNTQVWHNALAYAATYDLTVFIYPRDAYLGRDGCVHESALSTRMGLTGIPVLTETIALARDLLLIEKLGIKAHFCRLSSADSVALIAKAQKKGLSVTADVAMHQLFLTEADNYHYDTRCHVYPPFRSEHDKQALRQGIKDGVITAICSDHQPQSPDAKACPYLDSATGISALDTFLPLGLQLAQELDLSWLTLFKLISQQPRKILRQSHTGLKIGKSLDLCIFDPETRWQCQPDKMYSMRYNTPFENWTLKGRITHTLLKTGDILSVPPLD